MPSENQPTKLDAKKVYLKDASFESPGSPQVFIAQPKQTNIDVQMTLSHRRVEKQQNEFEVVLKITATSNSEGNTLFIAEIEQAGLFSIEHVPDDKLEVVLEIACPHILLPFAREALASLVAKGGFPQLLLNPVNFEAIYRQKKEKQARSMKMPADALPN